MPSFFTDENVKFGPRQSSTFSYHLIRDSEPIVRKSKVWGQQTGETFEKFKNYKKGQCLNQNFCESELI